MREEDIKNLYESESYEFIKEWERIRKVETLVDALGKSEDWEEEFDRKYSDFINFVQTEHQNISPEILSLIPSTDKSVKERLYFSREYLENYRDEALKYSLQNLEDLLDQSQDRLPNLAISILPIKDTDLDKTDDLDDLIDEYQETIDILTKNLGDINENEEPKRYESQVQTIREYKELKNLLEDYKPLIELSLSYQQLLSYLGDGNEKQPDNNKITELFFGYLDGLLERFKDNEEEYLDNEILVNTIKSLSGDQNTLMRYYQEKILLPAQKKYQDEAENCDIEDYIKRNIYVMNPNKQISTFMGLYSLLKSKENEERERRIDEQLKEFVGI